MSKFSLRLSNLMKENSCTQQILADLLCVKRQTIGKYTSEIAEPSIETLIKIADYFGVSVDYLFGREDDFGNVTVAPSPASALTEEEREVIETFRAIPENIKGVALDTLHSFAQTEKRGRGALNKRA